MTGNTAFVLASGGGGGMTREEVLQLIEETVKTPMHFKGIVGGDGSTVPDLPNPGGHEGDTYLVGVDGSYSYLPGTYFKVQTNYPDGWHYKDPVNFDIKKATDENFQHVVHHEVHNGIQLDSSGIYYPIGGPYVCQATYLNNDTIQVWAKTEGIKIGSREVPLNDEIDYWSTTASKNSTIFKIDGGSMSAKKGDMFCSVGDKWVLIPSGDEVAGNMDLKGYVNHLTPLPSTSQAIKGMAYLVEESGDYTIGDTEYYKFDRAGDYGAKIYSVESDLSTVIDSVSVPSQNVYATVPPFNHLQVKLVSDRNTDNYMYLPSVPGFVKKISNNATWKTLSAGVEALGPNISVDGIWTKDVYVVLSPIVHAEKGDAFVFDGTSWILQNTHEEAPFRFGVENGVYGYYKAGADTLTPFSSGGSNVIEITDYTVIPNSYVNNSGLHRDNDQDTYVFDLGSDEAVVFAFICYYYEESIPGANRKWNLLLSDTSPETVMDSGDLNDYLSLYDQNVIGYDEIKAHSGYNKTTLGSETNLRYLYFTPSYSKHNITFPFKLWVRPVSDFDV